MPKMPNRPGLHEAAQRGKSTKRQKPAAPSRGYSSSTPVNVTGKKTGPQLPAPSDSMRRDAFTAANARAGVSSPFDPTANRNAKQFGSVAASLKGAYQKIKTNRRFSGK